MKNIKKTSIVRKVCIIGIFVILAFVSVLPNISGYYYENIMNPKFASSSLTNTIYVDDDNTAGPWDGTIAYPYHNQVVLQSNDLSVDAQGPYFGNNHDYLQLNSLAMGGVPPYKFYWEFGDATNMSGQNLSHLYVYPGDYTATVFVTDSENNTVNDIAEVYIEKGPLECWVRGDRVGYVDVPIQVFGHCIGGQPPYTWSWDFGGEDTSNEQNPYYTYTEPGQFYRYLTVTDQDNTISTSSRDINIYVCYMQIEDATGIAGQTGLEIPITGELFFYRTIDYFMTIFYDADKLEFVRGNWEDTAFENFSGLIACNETYQDLHWVTVYASNIGGMGVPAGFYTLVKLEFNIKASSEQFTTDLSFGANPFSGAMPSYVDFAGTNLFPALYDGTLMALKPMCGDANGDRQVNVGDVVFIINYVFRNGPAPNPLCQGDANGDGSVNIADAVYLINHVFSHDLAEKSANYVDNNNYRNKMLYIKGELIPINYVFKETYIPPVDDCCD